MSYATAYRLRQLPNGHIAREALHLKPAPDFAGGNAEDAEEADAEDAEEGAGVFAAPRMVVRRS